MHLTLGLTLFENNIRYWLGYLNALALLAIVGFLIYMTMSKREMAKERSAPNRTEFLTDDELEGRRLERVLGWSLVFVSAFAVAFLVYMLREPVRQDHSETYFDKGAVERGEELFAGPADEAYNSVLSLQCANCHGATGAGGSRNTVVDPDGPTGPEKPVAVVWKVPPLNTVLLRFTEEPECADTRRRASAICEVSDIITYGRPGTPMQPFGLAGGGAENAQTINDIIAFLRTIQISSDEAQQEATAAVDAAKDAPQEQIKTAQTALDEAQAKLDEERDKVLETLTLAPADASQPSQSEEDRLGAQCEEIVAQTEAEDAEIDETLQTEGLACRDYLDAWDAQREATAALEWAQKWAVSREDVSDGQLLFELNCARCHTKGWSVFDPTEPNGTEMLGEPGGGGGAGGGIGPNLRDGAMVRRFGDGETGFDLHQRFVTEGSNRNEAYGRNGQGSGKMPGFGGMLTEDQIKAIVEYERDGLESTTYGVDDAAAAEETEG